MMSRSSRVFFARCLIQVVVCGILLAVAAAQQSAEPNLELQRQAMRKLTPLAGKWSGATRWFTLDTTIELSFTEEVQYEGNGLVLRMHSSGRRSDGQMMLGSTNLISYDDQSGKYRIHLAQNKDEGLISVDEDGKGLTIDFPTAQKQTTRSQIRINEEGYWTEMHWVTEESGKPWMFLAGVLKREHNSPPKQKAGSPSQNVELKRKTE